MSSGLAALSSQFQFPIPAVMDFRGASGKHVGWREIANRAVYSDVVVMLNKGINPCSGFVQRPRRSRSDAFLLEASLESLQLSIALWVVRARLDMGQAKQAEKHLEVFGNELRAIIADDARFGLRELFQSCLQNLLNILFLHFRPQLAMHDEAAVTVQYGDQEIERSTGVDVRHVHVPVLVGLQGLHEAGAFGIAAQRTTVQSPGSLEYAVSRIGAEGNSRHRAS